MLTLLATGMLQRFGDLLVGGIVLALAAYGVQNGLFLAVLAGMHALLSLVVALAFAEPLADLLVSFELPAVYAFPSAFGLLLVGTAFGIRLAVGGYVPEEAVRFAPVIDKLGGGLVGAVAGMVVAGIFLITASVVPVPEAFRIEGPQLRYDLGTRLLRTFARCVEPDDAKRAILLDGEPGSVPPPEVAAPVPVAAAIKDTVDQSKLAKRDKKAKQEPEPPPPPPPPPPPRCSEPFADVNGNKKYDEGEPYLDTDTDTAFTPRLTVNDINGNGKRDIGLLERYRMHAWGRQVMSIVAVDEASAPLAPVNAATPAAVPAAGAAVPAK
jgi:uncharacterized membrane protein required for colicin V production